MPGGVVQGDDGVVRCAWGDAPPIYRTYHDTEWGFPVHDDRRLFEKLCLEGFQSGLSWLTILRKRDAFRRAFADFDAERVAAFTEDDVERLLGDASIVRHRGKIEATINNARRALELPTTLDEHVWAFNDATALAKDLKRRGWRFVGPTTVYAFMQAMGLVNDHEPECAIRSRVEALRAARG